jgi:hypothetical protein
VYDPEISGQCDEINGIWDTKMTYSVYGGKECYSNKDAMETQPQGNYKSGNLLATKSFGNQANYDKNWYTFGPFNPSEGELVTKFDGYVFKVICDGVAGDDGNLYRYYLSTMADENKPVEGANAFAYEYSFRMHDDPNEVSHIYPFVDDRTITVKLFLLPVMVSLQRYRAKMFGSKMNSRSSRKRKTLHLIFSLSKRKIRRSAITTWW